jgi:hypothetical protein
MRGRKIKMITVDRGAVVTIEATFQKLEPFGNYSLESPSTTPQITVTAPGGEIMVNQQNMTLHSTGKYYYHVQTDEDWLEGTYTSKISAPFSPYTEIKIDNQSFILE